MSTPQPSSSRRKFCCSWRINTSSLCISDQKAFQSRMLTESCEMCRHVFAFFCSRDDVFNNHSEGEVTFPCLLNPNNQQTQSSELCEVASAALIQLTSSNPNKNSCDFNVSLFNLLILNSIAVEAVFTQIHCFSVAALFCPACICSDVVYNF